MMGIKTAKLVPLVAVVFFLSLIVIPSVEAQEAGPSDQLELNVENMEFSNDKSKSVGDVLSLLGALVLLAVILILLHMLYSVIKAARI